MIYGYIIPYYNIYPTSNNITYLNFIINPDKSTHVPFKLWKNNLPSLQFQEVEVPTTTQVKYLGISPGFTGQKTNLGSTFKVETYNP